MLSEIFEIILVMILSDFYIKYKKKWKKFLTTKSVNVEEEGKKTESDVTELSRNEKIK